MRGVNEKALAARTRKAEVTAAKQAQALAQKEDAKWVDDDKHVNAKLQRKEAEALKREEVLRRKAENKALEDQEVRTLESRKQGKSSAGKLTRAEIMKRQLIAAQKAQKTAEAESADSYQSDMLVENPNRAFQAEYYDALLEGREADISASGIDAALKSLEQSNNNGDTRIKMKGAFAKYEAEQMPNLIEEVSPS